MRYLKHSSLGNPETAYKLPTYFISHAMVSVTFLWTAQALVDAYSIVFLGATFYVPPDLKARNLPVDNFIYLVE